MKLLTRIYLSLALVGCGGAPFSAATPAADADPPAADAIAAVLEHDAGDELAVLAADASEAGDEPPVLEHDAGATGVLESGAVDAPADVATWTCDPAYGTKSPGGPCCLHVWATPTMGTVLCTVDGSKWCVQSGMPCSPPGSSCVVEPDTGVQYCAP